MVLAAAGCSAPRCTTLLALAEHHMLEVPGVLLLDVVEQLLGLEPLLAAQEAAVLLERQQVALAAVRVGLD
eukprot:9215383-Lingulodinium_polyedra.AAC.1